MENMIRTLERYMESLPKSRYLTLRYWIDTCSQSEQFLVNVCANGFHHLSEGGVIIPQNKPISLPDAYSVLADAGDPSVAEFVRTLVAKGGGDEDAAKTLHERYAELNKLRNMKYHKIKPREDASISLDNGRMEFVMGDKGKAVIWETGDNRTVLLPVTEGDHGGREDKVREEKAASVRAEQEHI